jgi:type I restriction enzyme S subunit
MTTAWKSVRLDQICTLISGQHINADDYNTHQRGVGYLTGPSDFGVLNPIVSKWTDNPKIFAKMGDILLTVKGSGVGKVNILDIERCAISRQLMAIRIHGPDVRFVYLFLASCFDYFQKISTGAAIPGISREQVLTLNLLLPPLSEQQRIVAILAEAFEAIATAKANTEKNLQNARALFETHLEASVTAPAAVEALHRLDEVCGITSSLIDPRVTPFLHDLHVGAGNIETGTGTLSNLQTAEEEGLISGKFPFDETMILYSKIRPYLRKVARPDFSGLCSADIYPLAPIPGKLTRDYLFYLLLSQPFTDYATEGSARSGMPKVNREHLFGYKVSLPPIGVQEAITEKLDELHQQSQRLESLSRMKLEALDSLMSSLLHQAFTGNL